MTRPPKRTRKTLVDEQLVESSAKQHGLVWSLREPPQQQPQQQTGEQEMDDAVEQQPLQHLPQESQQAQDATKHEGDLQATQDRFFDEMSEGSSLHAEEEEEAHAARDVDLPERFSSDAGTNLDHDAGTHDSLGFQMVLSPMCFFAF
jgi:hypothetical protein